MKKSPKIDRAVSIIYTPVVTGKYLGASFVGFILFNSKSAVKIHRIQTDDGIIGVWGCPAIDKAMKKKSGKTIRIRRYPNKKAKDGRPMLNVRVFVLKNKRKKK